MYTVFAQYRDQPRREHVPAFVCQTFEHALHILHELDRLGFARRGAFITGRRPGKSRP